MGHIFSSTVNQILSCWVLLLLLISLHAEQSRKVTIKPVSGPYNNSEDPHFDSKTQILTFVDQYKGKICNYDSKTDKTECTCPIDVIPVGPVIPVENSENEYIVGVGPYLVIVKWDGNSNSKPTVTTLGRYDRNAPGSVFNDGKADCKGRLFIDTRGKMLTSTTVMQNQASLFHYSKSNCNLKADLDRKGTFYNGVAWNCDYTRFYLIESLDSIVYGFDYDLNSATLSNQTVVFDFKTNNVSGGPDGMTIDRDNKLWIACFNGSRVIRVDPEKGVVLERIELPASGPTAVAWGGCCLDILYVTTSQLYLSKEDLKKQPLAGYVLAIHGLGFKGLPANNAAICTNGCSGCLSDGKNCTGRQENIISQWSLTIGKEYCQRQCGNHNGSCCQEQCGNNACNCCQK